MDSVHATSQIKSNFAVIVQSEGWTITVKNMQSKKSFNELKHNAEFVGKCDRESKP